LNLAFRISTQHGDDLLVVVDAADVVVGRSSTSDIRLPFKAVSAQHFRVRRDGSQWTVQDLGSSNGTAVDGAPLVGDEVRTLSDGSKIAIVDISITVEISENRSDGLSLTQSGSLLRALIADSEELATGAYFESSAGDRVPIPDAALDLRPPGMSIRLSRDGSGFAIFGLDTPLALDGESVPGSGAKLQDGAVIVTKGGTWTFRDPLQRHVAALDADEHLESGDGGMSDQLLFVIGIFAVVVSVVGLIAVMT
jgi:hypothetical protein